MSCDITLGRKLACRESVGGIDYVYFLNSDATFTLTSGVVTAFASGTKFYRYKLVGDNGLEEPGTVDQATGTSFHDQTLSLFLQQTSSSLQSELALMEQSLMKVIVKNNNGNYKLIGGDNGCVISVTPTTGTDFSGMNGYNVSVVGKEQLMSYFVNDDAIISSDIVDGV